MKLPKWNKKKVALDLDLEGFNMGMSDKDYEIALMTATVDDWVALGLDLGYADGFCYQHEMPELTEEEAKEWYDEGGDPCIPVLRVWV
jgi:hypothetical protein